MNRPFDGWLPGQEIDGGSLRPDRGRAAFRSHGMRMGAHPAPPGVAANMSSYGYRTAMGGARASRMAGNAIGANASEALFGPGMIRRGGSALRRGGSALVNHPGGKFLRSYGLAGAAIDVTLGAAFSLAGGIREGSNWYAESGREEDLIGGFSYGFNTELAYAKGSTIGYFAGAAIGSLVPGVGTAIGALAGGVVGSIAGGIIGQNNAQRAAYHRGKFISRSIAGQLAQKRVQFGRGFRDTGEAATMRQMAIQEASGSLMNARQTLGNEAFFLHS